jgi:(4-(4-[2-(gamma-L-glutamylamino)ethyl]phenoxymethyl)furan-2-yl)methanamine synthase
VPVPHDSILGWDLGGAHIKAARIDGRGCVEAVVQLPCPLWQGLDRLESGIDSVLERLGDCSGLGHAVTMTGELVDLFPDRASGVKALIDTMGRRFPTQRLAIYGGAAGFLTSEHAMTSPLQVASANWLATASWAARRLPEGLLIDVGSTTTDLIPFADSQVLACGYTDHERLASQALIYTGVVRTPLMAVSDKVPFAGEWVHMMAEHFATTADIHRLNGDLPDGVDLLPSADNGEKSDIGSARRLASGIALHRRTAAAPADGRLRTDALQTRHLTHCPPGGRRCRTFPGAAYLPSAGASLCRHRRPVLLRGADAATGG